MTKYNTPEHLQKISILYLYGKGAILTCQGRSQSRGIGNAPNQAPSILHTEVICRLLSHMDIAL